MDKALRSASQAYKKTGGAGGGKNNGSDSGSNSPHDQVRSFVSLVLISLHLSLVHSSNRSCSDVSVSAIRNQKLAEIQTDRPITIRDKREMTEEPEAPIPSEASIPQIPYYFFISCTGSREPTNFLY